MPSRAELLLLREAVLVLVLGLGGCDLESPPAEPLVTPQLVEVQVTIGYDEGAPIRTRLDESRRPSSVSRATTIVLRFDRFLHPASVLRQAICLRPSTEPVDTLDDCARPGQPFLQPRYLPAQRQVVYQLPPGERLSPDTLYRLTLFPPTEDSDFGFRAFDGAPLRRHYRFDLVTASEDAAAIEEPQPTPSRYCDALRCAGQCRDDPSLRDDPVAQRGCIADRCDCLDPDCTADGDLTDPSEGIFATSCAFGGCHAGGDAATGIPWGTAGAAMGLDLGAPDAIAATAIGKAAHQAQTGERAAVAEVNGVPFGRAMPIVAPSNPGNSYLLYKLIARRHNHGQQPDGPLDAELERLRASVVTGQPMPPDDALLGSASDPDGRRAWERLLLFEAWIAHGAVTACD
ncbi:MAG: hypothetical protein JRI23_36025 [Deltaproteobacteria bacterium]|nr:hypothetical protein [Deltaproteobacteria bacterium]MBW2537758.1 hypothetical protein [Deltaproteobacteria bacterium]